MSKYRDQVAQWLETVAWQAGVPLPISRDGHCRLQLHDGSECILEVPDDSAIVFIYAPIDRLPDDAARSTLSLKAALSLNLFGLQTGGSSFGYDPRSDHLVLTFSASLDLLDEALFCQVLGDFIESAMAAKARYQEAIFQGKEHPFARPLLPFIGRA